MRNGAIPARTTPRRSPTTTAVLAAAALGVLAACGGGGPDAPASGLATADVSVEPGTTLSVWTFGATGLEPLMETWAEENGAELEIKTGEFDPHHEQLLTALVSGEVPDVAVVEVSYSSLFKASPERFTDLRDFGAAELEGDYLDWRWEHGVADDGTIIGIPTDVGGLALAYRTDLFEAAGLPTEPDEVAGLWSSWDEFLDVAADYTAETGEPFLDDSGILFETVVRQGETMFYDGDGELVHDTNPQVQRAWEVATRAGSEGLTADLAGFTPEWNTAMARGAYAVQLAPAWMLNYIQGQAPDTSGLWNVSTLPEGGGNWGGSQLTVPAAADHPEAAWDLIRTVLSPESQFEVFEAGGNFPTTPELYDTPELQGLTSEFFSGAPLGEIYTESVTSLTPVVEGRDQRTILRELTAGVDQVEKGERSPDDAWQGALEAIDRELR